MVLSKLSCCEECHCEERSNLILNWLESEKIIENIDVNDVDFVALTKFLKATLWTGDKILYNGLKAIAFKKIMKTNELLLKINLQNP